MPDLIRANWVKNGDIARRNGVTLSPEHFAQRFVDSNFAIKASGSAWRDQ
jgi:hypothetical protein